MSRKRLDRIGEINESNNHGTMKINKYHNARNIEVKFKNTGNVNYPYPKGIGAWSTQTISVQQC